MSEKTVQLTKNSVTKSQSPVSQQEKTNSSRSNNPSINRILNFQKALGNEAVQGILRSYVLQTKLKIGKPNDKYEQEADRVAEKIMTFSIPSADQLALKQGEEGVTVAQKKPFSQIIPLLLKKKEEDEESTQPTFMLQQKAKEDEEIKAKPLILRKESEEEKEEEKARTKLFIQKQDEEEKEEKEELQTKPLIQKQQEESEEEEDEELQAKELSGHTPEIPSNIEMDINNIRGGGQPLSADTRAFFEPRFGYDFSPVKVHTDSRSADASESLHARAFSIGHDIFFGESQYKPEKTAGRHLIAHELTHVVQQGGGRALNKAEIINRWYSHLNKSKNFLARKEDSEKEKGQSEQLHRNLSPLKIDRVNDSKIVQGGFLDWVAEKGSAAVKGVKKLGSQVKKGVTVAAGPLIEKAKEYIADKVKNVPGYELATYILGKDPITQKKVSKNSGGFLKLIFKLLGAEETYDKLVKSKVVNKAYGLLANALQRAKLTWEFIVKSIKGIWAFLTKNPLGLITALGMAKDFFFSLVSKTIQVGKNLLTEIPLLVLEGFLILVGAPVKKIMGIINKGKEVILYIANDPMKFVGHLVGALKKGFFQFKDNIWKHLKAGLLSWLFGTLQKAGITMPEKFDLKGIFSLVMQILGITYARIREKVVKVIGEKNMQRIEKAWEFIKALVTGGIGALWEKIKESLGSLKDMVIGAIKNWVVTKIVVSAISKLASMFNPVGAIIQAALTIYNTIMFFIERAKQIAALVEAVFNSITDIAYGKITAAANWIEKTMARSIPVILSFLARLLNLGGIAEKIQKVIGKIQEKVDKAIDKVIGFIVKKAKALFGKAKALLKKGAKSLKDKIVNWWQEKQKFKQGKESHTLFFKGEDENAELMVKSTRRPLEKYIIDLRESLKDKYKEDYEKTYKKTLNDIEKLQKQIYKEKTRESKKTGKIKAKYYGAKAGEEIRKKLIEIVLKLKTLPGLDAEEGEKTIRPPSKAELGEPNTNYPGSSDGTEVEAWLSINPNGLVGGRASKPSKLYNDLKKQKWKDRIKMGRKLFIMGHLLNHHLYGTGKEYRNLTPIPDQLNKKMEEGFESEAKKLVFEKNQVIYYKVKVDYPSKPEGSSPLKYIAKGLSCLLKIMKFKKDKPNADKANMANWEKDKKDTINFYLKMRDYVDT